MIKLVAFDLDGVLVDAKDIHFEALNTALAAVDQKFLISEEEHLSIFDGLPTIKKLQILSAQRGLPVNLYEQISSNKQEETIRIMRNKLTINNRLINILKQLKSAGMQICVASNSIRKTVVTALVHTGLIEHIDFFLSNQDVINAKPSPEIYLKCMIAAGVGPDETIIVEDSPVGQKAAISSGGHLCPVKNSDDVSLDKISKIYLNLNKNTKKKWTDSELNIIIPMAGQGSRFEKAGYAFPKPLIDVMGKPMIQMVVENLNINANYIYVVRKEHYDKYNLQYMLNLITPNCKIVLVDQITEGAACTVLLAKDHINNDNPLLLANSDQYVEWDSSEFLYSMNSSSVDGGILTFTAVSPKWSFVKLDEHGYVSEVAEKKPISNIATCGIYWFRKGSDFVSAAENMMYKNIRVNNEFYVCPVFNEMIECGKKIKTNHINNMWGTGTPEDLSSFISNYDKIFRNAT
jgi:HAD superfamily hydrolase (TIGR01509 family)